MHTLKRQVMVPYSARQMFELVNGIEEYPRFLPWCHTSKIISQSETEIVATLEIRWNGMSKHFTTRNSINAYQKIEIQLVDGPLKRLEGIWQFNQLEELGSQVLLELEFEFSGSFIDRLFQPIFQSIAGNLVDAFCKRAAELYGTQS